jgi:hypothetical protein
MAGRRYCVVNRGRGRSTHISTGRVRGLSLATWSGSASILCGLPATRLVDVFSTAEASCRECRRRWQLAIQGKPTGRPTAAPRPAVRAPHGYQAGRLTEVPGAGRSEWAGLGDAWPTPEQARDAARTDASRLAPGAALDWKAGAWAGHKTAVLRHDGRIRYVVRRPSEPQASAPGGSR